MNSIKASLEEIIKGGYGRYAMFLPIETPLGSVSVQASPLHYSVMGDGGWESLELGFPSIVPPPQIMEFAEDEENPLNTVYSYVPIDVVRNWINELGGDLLVKSEVEDE